MSRKHGHSENSGLLMLASGDLYNFMAIRDGPDQTAQKCKNILILIGRKVPKIGFHIILGSNVNHAPSDIPTHLSHLQVYRHFGFLQYIHL